MYRDIFKSLSLLTRTLLVVQCGITRLEQAGRKVDNKTSSSFVQPIFEPLNSIYRVDLVFWISKHWRDYLYFSLALPPPFVNPLHFLTRKDKVV